MSLWKASVHFFAQNKVLNDVTVTVMQDMRSNAGF
jgi:hypothetical protein